MKKLTTAIMVLSLVLGGVALAAAADLPQASKSLQLSVLQKISDQEAQQIRGTGGGLGVMNAGVTCPNVCQSPLYQKLYVYGYSYDHNYLTPGPKK
jgi:hypothetical protein